MIEWVQAGFITLVSVVAATGVSYGATKAKVDNLKEDVDAVKDVPVAIARLETKVDLLLSHRGAGNPPPPNDG